MSLPVERCDLCIVGAGLSGLNALFVASRHLSRDQRVILVDRRDRVGGMWVDTYPYVRLHQPHQLFTAGDIKWALGQKPAYLASKGEILDHFERCRRIIEERLWVDEFFGWTVESEHEADGLVRVLCRSADGRPNVIETQRLIKASGFRVDPRSVRCHRIPATCAMPRSRTATRRSGSSAAEKPRWTPHTR
jgi:cation diffusion facilitator CzcD-associated flavoprotein CzcO